MDEQRAAPPAEEALAGALKKHFRDGADPVLIAVGGPGGTGKTSFAVRLGEALGGAGVLSLDDYKTPRKQRAEKNIYGPHPDANDMALIRLHLGSLRRGESINKPVYCRKRGMTRLTEEFHPGRFVIAEGETACYQYFSGLFDVTLFIDSDLQTQLNTRFERDIRERGYTPQKAGAAFIYSNLIEFPRYGACGAERADILIRCGRDYRLSIKKISDRFSDDFLLTSPRKSC